MDRIHHWRVAYQPAKAKPFATRILLAAAILGGFIVGFGSEALYHDPLVNALLAITGAAGIAAVLLYDHPSED